MDRLSVEHAYLVGFNLSMDIIGIFLISVGSSRKCFFYKKSIATFLVLSGAERFILLHNHPDGTLDVSDDDFASSFYIKSLADILEIEFIDSVIVSRNGWRCINRNEICEYDEEDRI
jgi:DNA repair protein RadC